MSNELTLIIAIIGVFGSLASIVVAFSKSKKEDKKEGKEEGVQYGELESDMQYIKRTQTDILVGQREINSKLDGVTERTIRLDEKYKSLDKRVTKLEKDKEGV